MVGTDGRAGGHVALALDAGGHQEGIVVVLLVRREDEVVEDLAAGNRGVVAEDGVDQAGAELEGAVVADHEADGRAGVEDTAAQAHDAVDHDDVLADLGRLLLGGVDRDVLELARTLDVAGGADLRVLDDGGILDHASLADGAVVAAMAVHGGLGDLAELLLQGLVVDVLGPHVGVRRRHSVERIHRAAAGLVHHLDLDADVLGLAVLDDAVAELGVVRGAHLLDVEEHAAVADDIVGEIMDVVDGAVVADVAGVDRGVGDADRQAQVVELEAVLGHAPDADRAVELVVLDPVRAEFVRDQDGVPAGGRVVVHDQGLDLVAGEVPPAAARLAHLLVADIILILPFGNEFGIDPAVDELFGR